MSIAGSTHPVPSYDTHFAVAVDIDTLDHVRLDLVPVHLDIAIVAENLTGRCL